MAGFWRKCRRCFRWLRFAIWAVLLLLLLCFAWFNLIGLPDFLKSRLTTTLHERGLDLNFSRMRLKTVRGLVVENVRAGGTNDTDVTSFTAKEIQLRLNYAALFHRKLELAGLALHAGEFTFPASPTNALTVSGLESDLDFLSGDTWSLNRLTAEFGGVKFQLSGQIAHARELQHWPLFAKKKSGAPADHAAPLAQLARTLEKIKFSGQPKVNLTVTGDARAADTFKLQLDVVADGVQTPWLEAGGFRTAAQITAAKSAPTNCDPAWGFWTNLQPFRIRWDARADTLQVRELRVRAADIHGEWNAPEVSLANVSAQFGGGNVFAATTLNVDTRRLTFTNDSFFDIHAIAGFLNEQARARLEKIEWTLAPHLAIGGELQLPPWSAEHPDWRADIEPTVAARGMLGLTNANVGKAKVDLLAANFGFSNLLWTLPELRLEGGRTKLKLSSREDERTKNFSAHVAGFFDPEVIRPFLTTSNAVRGFSHLNFSEPLALDLDAHGNITNFQSLAASGNLALTNAAIRQQTVDWLTTRVRYTNFSAEFLEPRLARAGGAQNFSAEKVTLDIAGQRLFFTNGDATVDPMVVARAIGPRTAASTEPYQFLAIPHAHVNGCVPLKQKNGDLVLDDADLYFDIIEDTPFRWKKFETPTIHGLVWWKKNMLIVTNAVTECYTGSVQGWGSFDTLTEGEGTDFSFFITGTNVDLDRMAMALWAKTNQLAGALSGEIHVTSANSSDWRTWDGFGSAKLRGGVLWDVPVIGLVSTALSMITPGLEIGNSRATDATGTFAMTNGVIFTDSLEIRSLTMRIQYVGTVTLDLQLDARAKAQLLRNVPLFGWIVSAVLSPVGKAFECKVTGPLGKPKIEPVYVPKMLLAPLHPIQTMENIFSGPNTNAAAEKP